MSERLRCTATRKDGSPCRGFALGDTGLCMAHSLTEEERKERSSRGGRNRAARHRFTKRTGFRPGVTPEDVLRVVKDAMLTDFSDVGLPGEADWNTRLLAVFTLLHTFPEHLRTTPETAHVLIEKSLPESLKGHAARFDVQREYTNARRAWFHSHVRSRLGSLFYDELPDFLIAPWETREEVMRKEAPDLSKAEMIVAQDGTLLIERPGEPGLVDVVSVDA